MKAFLAALSVIALLGLASPSLAGPNVGSPRFGQRVTEYAKEKRERQGPYALTGDRVEAQEYRWVTKTKKIGARSRHRVYVRVPVDAGNK